MYTELKTYQIIIALLKKYGITHCVLSAGSRNVPFVHSIEEDPEFHCYSVVDERSAGYFALGLAQELNQPVVISCTSSTATCNYWPPVAEAFYQGVPIVVLTSDRDPEMLGQWEDQMIDQVGMYDRHVRKSVNLPIINNHDDEIYCQRLVNEAWGHSRSATPGNPCQPELRKCWRWWWIFQFRLFRKLQFFSCLPPVLNSILISLDRKSVV